MIKKELDLLQSCIVNLDEALCSMEGHMKKYPPTTKMPNGAYRIEEAFFINSNIGSMKRELKRLIKLAGGKLRKSIKCNMEGIEEEDYPE